MIKTNPKNFIYIGFVLLLLGVALPMLMILQILESTYFLNFFAYACQIVGLTLGIIGIAYISAKNRNKKQ
jgi:hypothetical protein